MYLSQANQEDLKLSPRQLETLFASSALFDPAAIDEVEEDNFLDPFDEGYDRSDFWALRLLGKINDPRLVYNDPSDTEYNDDYLDDNRPEQVPYPLRILDEVEEDSNELPNLRLAEESDEEDIIPGEEPRDSSEPEEEPEEELEERIAA